MGTPVEKLKTIAHDIAELNDRDLQAEVLLEYAARFKEVPPHIATRPFQEQFRIPGCESQVFIWNRPAPSGAIHLYFAVENPQGISAKALAVILDETLSGALPEELHSLSPDSVLDLFGQNISMGRGEGLMNMVKAVQRFARRP